MHTSNNLFILSKPILRPESFLEHNTLPSVSNFIYLYNTLLSDSVAYPWYEICLALFIFIIIFRNECRQLYVRHFNFIFAFFRTNIILLF